MVGTIRISPPGVAPVRKLPRPVADEFVSGVEIRQSRDRGAKLPRPLVRRASYFGRESAGCGSIRARHSVRLRRSRGYPPISLLPPTCAD